jgi:hypothetical protein
VPHLALSRAPLRAVPFAVILAVAGTSACERRDRPNVDTARPATSAGPTIAACRAPWGGRIETVSRDSVIAWAQRLTYADPDTMHARLFGYESIKGASAAIHQVGGLREEAICVPPAGGGCIIARVVTNRAHPRLGLAVGTNYIWADNIGDSLRAAIIPEDRRAPVVGHRMRHHRWERGGAPPARVLGTGNGDGSCESCGDACWCDWPSDTVRLRVRLLGDTALVRPGRDTGSPRSRGDTLVRRPTPP